LWLVAPFRPDRPQDTQAVESDRWPVRIWIALLALNVTVMAAFAWLLFSMT
jgi:hypothetical protein